MDKRPCDIKFLFFLWGASFLLFMHCGGCQDTFTGEIPRNSKDGEMISELTIGHPQAAKVLRSPAVLAALAMLVGAIAGCGEPSDVSERQAGPLDGHVAISWTLNASTLNKASCQAAGIAYMNIGVVSQRDQSQSASFQKIDCGLDRFAMATLPRGPVNIFVFAKPQDGLLNCLYEGQADATAGPDFPSLPISVVLTDDGSCEG